MQTTTIGRLFPATFAFLGQNWLLILGTMVAAIAACALTGYAVLVSWFERANGDFAAGDAGIEYAFQIIGLAFLWVLLASVILYAAYFLIWRVALSGGEQTVGSSIGWSLLAGLTSTLATIAILIALYILLIIVVLIVMLVFGASGGLDPTTWGDGGIGSGFIAGIVIFYILMLLFYVWLTARFLVTGPAMVGANSVNPFSGLVQSWRLTSRSQWSIFGFLLLVTLAFILIWGVFSAVLGGLGIGPGASPERLTDLIVGVLLVYVPLLAFYAAAPAGVYRELAEPQAHDIGATFN